MRDRRRAGVLIFFAAIAFTNAARNPRFETFHTVDILQLLAAGMCLGVALALVLGRRSGQKDI
jgi:hypothetical protein